MDWGVASCFSLDGFLQAVQVVDAEDGQVPLCGVREGRREEGVWWVAQHWLGS